MVSTRFMKFDLMMCVVGGLLLMLGLFFNGGGLLLFMLPIVGLGMMAFGMFDVLWQMRKPDDSVEDNTNKLPP